MRKQYIFLGLVLVLVGLAIAGVLLWPKAGGLAGKVGSKQTEDTATENKSEAKVVSWQPETATGMQGRLQPACRVIAVGTQGQAWTGLRRGVAFGMCSGG